MQWKMDSTISVSLNLGDDASSTKAIVHYSSVVFNKKILLWTESFYFERNIPLYFALHVAPCGVIFECIDHRS